MDDQIAEAKWAHVAPLVYEVGACATLLTAPRGSISRAIGLCSRRGFVLASGLFALHRLCAISFSCPPSSPLEDADYTDPSLPDPVVDSPDSDADHSDSNADHTDSDSDHTESRFYIPRRRRAHHLHITDKTIPSTIYYRIHSLNIYFEEVFSLF